MVVGVKGLVASRLIIAEDVVVTVAQDLASVKLYINVTKYVLVTVSQCLSHNSKNLVFINVSLLTALIIIGREKWEI
jgi:hypothetical protein